MILQNTTAQLKMIRLATVRAQEAERNRISRELHDNIKQLIVTAKLHIGMARVSQEQYPGTLQKAEEYLGLAIEAIRALTRELTGSVVTHEGLEKALLAIATDLYQLKGTQLEIRVCYELFASLRPERQLMIYRIIQEQTTNILQYAEAACAQISLRVQNGMAELLITDNGKGFDKEQNSGGVGFINIYNRVDACGGTARITSAPGAGCSLLVEFPLQEKPADNKE